MKKIIFAAILVTLTSTFSFAWECPKNPDRFPSIGLSLSGQAASADQSYPSFPTGGSQNREDSVGMFILDTRLPLSNSFTLDFAIGSMHVKQTLDETATLDSQKYDANGGYFKIGARYYFNGGAN